MASVKENTISIQDLTRLSKALFKFGVSHFKVLILVSVIGGVIGFFYAYNQKPVYTAALSFIINENEGGMANLSSLAGITGLGGFGGGSVNEDKLIFFVKSRFLVGSSLLKEVEINGVRQQLINRYIDVTELNKEFAKDTSLLGFSFFTHQHMDSLSYAENKVLDRILKRFEDGKLLKIESKKKTGLVAQNAGIVTIEFKSSDEVFAKKFTDVLYSQLSDYYINRAIQRQLNNYNLISKRADSIGALLSYKEEAGAHLFDKNLNMAKMTARLEVERTKRDAQMLGLMYAEVLKNLEIAKFNLESQTPVLQVVDQPTYPLLMKKMSKLKAGVVGGGLAFVLVFLGLLVFHYTKHHSLVV